MIITTGEHEATDSVLRAKQLAALTGSQYVSRSRRSLAKLGQAYPGEDILVLLKGGAKLVRPGAAPMTFHPSMSFIRAKRLLKGESDAMLEAANVASGDTIIDCTAGLGADAIIFAMGTGSKGKVIALEDSHSLWALLVAGLSSYRSGIDEFDEALGRIDVRWGEHLSLLRAMPSKSADIVYFDPMFREPVMESSSLSPLRMFANENPLSQEAIKEACRVARKKVVLKEKSGSGEFERLGFSVAKSMRSNITYGVIDP